MRRFISNMFDRLFVLAGAVTFSQIPLFIQQYTYRLEGHVKELKIQVLMLENIAAISNKNLDQYVQKFLSSQDIDFVNQGVVIQKMITRWQDLTAALQSIQNATPLTKFFAFLKHLQLSIVQDAFASFQPGFSLTSETIIFGLIGAISGFGLYQFILFFFGQKARTIS